MQIVSVLIGIVILYFIQRFLYEKFWDYKLNTKVTFLQTHMVEGGNVTIEECLENRKWLPLPVVKLKYNLSNSFFEENNEKQKRSDRYNRNEVFTILMYQRIRRKVNFVCKRRGIYRIENINTSAVSLFGDETYLNEIENDKRLVVYPRCVDASDFMDLFRNVYGNIITKQFLQEDPFMSRGVREYQSYDSMKNINWSASAKTGELKVNVLEHTSQREAIVFLNLQRDTILMGSEVSEECIRLAKTFCLELAKQGVKSELYTNGRHIDKEEYVVVEKIDRNLKYMDVINESLAHIVVNEGGNVYTEYEDDKFVQIYKDKIKKVSDNKYLIFISNYQRQDFIEMLLELKDMNKDFSWIIPVSNRADYHSVDELREYTKVWRINWEGARRGGQYESVPSEK